MRWAAVTGLAFALAACGGAAEESDDPMPAAPAPAPAPEVVAAADGWAGTYEFEIGGKKTTAVLMAEGTYSDTVDGEIVESGVWHENAEGQVCFDPIGEQAPPICYTAGERAEDGSLVVTPDDGEPLTVKKVG